MNTPYSPADPKVDNLGLAKVEKGKAPSARIKDPKRAQELGHLLIQNNEERSRKNAIIKGQIDGNRPYNPTKLRAAAQAWRTNVNFGEAEAAVSAALTPFYDLFTGAKYYFFAETKFGANVKEQNDFGRAITELANEWVEDEWDGFDFNMQAMLFDMVAYGKGFLLWLDPTDWRFEWVPQYMIYVPDSTKAHTSKLPVLMVRGSYQVHELWKKISNPKASDAGWNVPFAKICIENAYPPQRGTTGQHEFEDIQQRMKDNDLCEGMEASQIPVFHLFVAEFDGSVSHLIVPETQMPTADRQSKSVEWLFESRSSRNQFGNVIAPFFFETLDGSWNGANGLGKKIFDAIELKNRLKCGTVDGGFLRSAITLQAVDSNALEKLSVVQIGAFSVIPPGFNVQPSTIMGDLQGPMAVERMLEQTISSNTGIYRPKMDKPEGNPRTAEEVRLNFQASATLSTSAVNRFYKNLDRFYKELMRRLAKDPAFRKRCKEIGLPEKALDNIGRVRAHRAVGNGSAFMRQQAQSRIAPIVSMMPEEGRIEWARDTVSSEMNGDSARRYFPETQDDVLRTDHAYDATLENSILKLGGPVLVTPKQNDVIHAQTHLHFAAAAAESLQQGANPIEVLNTLDQIGRHTVEHIQRIAQDEFRGNEQKALHEQWKRLASFADQLRQKIKEDAEAAQEQAAAEQQAQAVEQGIDPEVRIKLAQAQQDMLIKQQKAELQNRLKVEAHTVKTALADAKTASGIALAKAKQESTSDQDQ